MMLRGGQSLPQGEHINMFEMREQKYAATPFSKSLKSLLAESAGEQGLSSASTS